MNNIRFESFSKEQRFRDLCRAVQYCNLCPRLCERNKVLSKSNGNINSKVMFVAEAPGRLGADRTGIPLYGDKTGDNFEKLLSNIGWDREQIFVTNAVLCNPRNEQGNNSTPTKTEIANCNVYLQMTIQVIQPDVIVTLGKTALDAMTMISPHNLLLKESVAQAIPFENRILFPLYHPGPRALIHRSIINQRGDFFQLAKLVDPLKGVTAKRKKTTVKRVQMEQPTILVKIAIRAIQLQGRLTLFKLTKLLYLIDLEALNQLGRTLTGEIYLRQQEGPWIPTLADSISALNGYELNSTFVNKIPVVTKGDKPRFNINLDSETEKIINEVVEEYGKLTDAGIKRVVYRTRPMKYILQQEKLGRDMRKIPVIYRDKISSELDVNGFSEDN